MEISTDTELGGQGAPFLDDLDTRADGTELCRRSASARILQEAAGASLLKGARTRCRRDHAVGARLWRDGHGRRAQAALWLERTA
jgi:hypothetical protein